MTDDHERRHRMKGVRYWLSTAIGVLGLAIAIPGMLLIMIAIRLRENPQEPETLDPELSPICRGDLRD